MLLYYFVYLNCYVSFLCNTELQYLPEQPCAIEFAPTLHKLIHRFFLLIPFSAKPHFRKMIAQAPATPVQFAAVKPYGWQQAKAHL